MAKGDVGKRVGVIMAERGFRPTDFARKVEVTPQRLNNWISGSNDPPLEMLLSLANALETTVEDVLGSPASLLSQWGIGGQPSTKTLLKSYGVVPQDNWKPGPEWVEVDAQLSKTDLTVTVGQPGYGDRFPAGSQLAFRGTRHFKDGKYHLILSHQNRLYIGAIFTLDGESMVEEPGGKARPLGRDRYMGYLVYEKHLDEDGIGPL